MSTVFVLVFVRKKIPKPIPFAVTHLARAPPLRAWFESVELLIQDLGFAERAPWESQATWFGLYGSSRETERPRRYVAS